MKPRAIIYCSKHGSTKEYATILAKKMRLPVMNIDHISGYSFQNIPVYFCGWICNGKVKGLSKARKLFMCVQVIGVGSYEYNEAYELKLKYRNEIQNEDFKYVQSIHPVVLNRFEKIYVSLFPSSFVQGKVKVHEYTI